jgi:putative SOS response-associated peptidase YedK
MCGRFVQAGSAGDYAEYFGAEIMVTEALQASYNVAPTDAVYAVAEHRDERLLGTFRWGLVPFWAKDRKLAARNINARMETAATKPAFRDSFATKRCLIPADGFYEWEPRPKGKLPHYIYRASNEPLAFAGLWASWKDPETGERVRTCTILTGRPDDLVAPIHDRMPVALPRDNWDEWLATDNHDVARLESMLGAVDRPQLTEHPVSTLVNKVANNVPELIAPLETGAVG